ncbi:SLAM family member 8-like [Pongo pygmaeus]|uniref:SLAM family member 8-like n=1 Tax=Pongo pygmaeus TaxID=9600 RepID=UPI00300CF600
MAVIRLTGGRLSGQVFYLTVYEPVPHPEILAKSLSITPGLCNITLECRVPGATEDLNVTWESKGLLGELEQRETPGPAPNPWTLAVSLPLSQRNSSLTCVVSNHVHQKAVTLVLGKVCVKEQVHTNRTWLDCCQASYGLLWVSCWYWELGSTF